MPVKHPVPPKAAIQRLLDKRLSFSKIGAHYGVSAVTATTWVRGYGLSTTCKLGPARRELPVDEIRRLVGQGLQRLQIAVRLDCGLDLLDRVMREHGIKTARQVHIEQGKTQRVRNVRPSARAQWAANPFGISAHDAHF